MSKRAEEKERLARLLAAGEISPRVYDERMARMGHRGRAQQERHQADLRARKAPQEWSPSAAPKRAVGRPDKGYVIVRQMTMPPSAAEALKAAQLPGETIGETVARRFGWSPASASPSSAATPARVDSPPGS